ncbi:MAG: hypothetical protein J7494_00635 [Sphingobium sp.]|nr:hypothetical protein [Sphingobium sp.]
MTAIELAAMALAFGAILSAMLFRRALPWLLACAGLALMAALLFNPARWQLYPAAPALLFLVLPLLRHARVRRGVPIASAALAGLSAALALLFAMPTLPRPGGPYPVGTASHGLERPSSDGPRHLYLKIWYPARAAAGRTEGLWRDLAGMSDIPWYARWGLAYLAHAPTQSHPGAPYAATGRAPSIVLYNHSFVSWASENSLLAEDLASRGMIVVAVRALGQVDEYRRLDSEATRNPLKPDGADVAVAMDLIRRRTDDSRFVVANLGKVLSMIPGMPGSRPTTYEAIGFSLGGAVSTGLCASDPQCRAVVNIDGAIPGIDYPRLPIPHYLMIYSGANFARVGAVRRGAQGGYRERVFGQAVHADFHDSAIAIPATRWIFGRSGATLTKERRKVAEMIAQFLENAAKDERPAR